MSLVGAGVRLSCQLLSVSIREAELGGRGAAGKGLGWGAPGRDDKILKGGDYIDCYVLAFFLLSSVTSLGCRERRKFHAQEIRIFHF